MVDKENLSVVWSKLAGKQLEKAYNKIKEDSYQSAEKVRSEILQKAREIGKVQNPDIVYQSFRIKVNH